VLEVREFGIGLCLAERIGLDAHDLVVEKAMQLDDLVDEFGMRQSREVTVEDGPQVIMLEHGDDSGVVGDTEARVRRTRRPLRVGG